jgi:hypothetical protein
MRLVVNLGKSLKIKVCIDLRGCNLGMAKQLLNSAQVTTGLQKMAREGMSQHMGVHGLGEPKPFSGELNQAIHGPSIHTLAQAINKNWALQVTQLKFAKNLCTSLEPGLNGLRGRASHGKSS